MTGFAKLLRTTAVVGVGLTAIAVDKVVKDKGSEAITIPASALYNFAYEYVAPYTAFATHHFAGFFDGIGQRLGEENQPAELGLDHNASVKPVSRAASDFSEAPAHTDTDKIEGGDDPKFAKLSDQKLFAQCDPSSEASDTAVLGDRVSLRFFEVSALTAPGGPAGSTPENIVFERLDLAGTYEVGANGAVSLPAIGHVDVIGRDLACIEDIVRLAARERLHLDGTVSAAFAYRPPVLVRGSVRSPGSHAYSPGLTVKRVLAQAGALEKASILSPQQRAVLHAHETELQAQDAGLLVEKARIQATLENDLSLDEHIPSVGQVAEVLGAERIESERRLLLSDLAAEQVTRERMRDRISDLASRVEAAREHLAIVEMQLKQHTDRAEVLAALLQRGVIAEDKVEDARLRQMATQRVVLERRDALMQLESDLRLTERELDLREVERKKLLFAQARELAAQRTTLHEQIRTVYAQLNAYEDDGGQTYLVTIERPDEHGVDQFHAEPDTTVKPGDLVTVANVDTTEERDATPTSLPRLDHQGATTASREWLKRVAILK